MGHEALGRCIQGDALPQHFAFQCCCKWISASDTLWRRSGCFMAVRMLNTANQNEITEPALLLQRQKKRAWKLGGREIVKKSLSRHPCQSVGQDVLVRKNSELEQFWTIIWWNPFISWEEAGEAVFSWPQRGFVHLILWNSFKWTQGDTDIPSQGRPLFPFAQRGTSRLWHEDRKPPVSWASRQHLSSVSSLSAAWMCLIPLVTEKC